MNKLLAAEKKFLQKLCPTLRGYHLLLLGDQRPLSWLPKNRLHNFTLAPTHGSALSHYETLPLRNNSIDVVFMAYELEYCEEPLLALQELHRCLLSQGKLFIFFTHAWHPFNLLKKSLSFLKVKHLLELADFEYKKSYFLHFGSVIVIEAQKNTLGMTPLLKPKWEEKLILEKQWQPTTRKIHD
ncbi:MAG TPA: methyltransferase domain-containing protein [Gammaproteobacteria bacterium]|nr:methyltransferase domain-containing protein [Gammaproteobacteria bacterium]